MNKKVGVIGTGSFVPENILTNSDLEKMVDTSDQWIRERTGIIERRIADDNTSTSDLATKAALCALEDAGLSPEQVELIIVATVTPDQFFPATACQVQKNINAVNAVAFDLSAACSGFIFALSVAERYIDGGIYNNALVISADTLSKVTDWKDRNTCVLFGDGAGAFVLGKVDKGGILSAYLGSEGAKGDLLTCPACFFSPEETEKRNGKKHTTWMNGPEIFKFATKIMPFVFEEAINKAGLSVEQIDWFVPHQANLRIISSAAKKFNVEMDRFIVTLQKYGNTSASSIPIAVDDCLKNGKIKKGETLAMAAFGGGLTYASAIITL